MQTLKDLYGKLGIIVESKTFSCKKSEIHLVNGIEATEDIYNYIKNYKGGGLKNEVKDFLEKNNIKKLKDAVLSKEDIYIIGENFKFSVSSKEGIEIKIFLEKVLEKGKEYKIKIPFSGLSAITKKKWFKSLLLILN